jgi:hypothetical protein
MEIIMNISLLQAMRLADTAIFFNDPTRLQTAFNALEYYLCKVKDSTSLKIIQGYTQAVESKLMGLEND